MKKSNIEIIGRNGVDLRTFIIFSYQNLLEDIDIGQNLGADDDKDLEILGIFNPLKPAKDQVEQTS